MSNRFKCAHLSAGKCAVIGLDPTCDICEEECGDFEAREDDADSDLSTLTRLLRCPCGGWLEVESRGVFRDEWHVWCACGVRTVPCDTPAAAVMAFHREHGG